ncbi:unnamed protein product [Leptidea sinapis]|uniref:Uncharacterized protein n=1 Tax=Leptidea sinapis TaxID=189913 RepID=A0A5E4PQ74_9NEOP|nr:unnamed protein product [Leptidea sinapis]
MEEDKDNTFLRSETSEKMRTSPQEEEHCRQGETTTKKEDLTWKALLKKLKEKILERNLTWEEKIKTCWKILYMNAQSLHPKLTEFDLLLNQVKVHVAIISETWLSLEDSLQIRGYNVFRSERTDCFGGVAILTHRSLKVQQQYCTISNTLIEIIAI